MNDLVKKIRQQTGAGVMEIKKALDEAGGSEERALAILRSRGLKIVQKKVGRATERGRIELYLHGDPPTIGAMVEVLCETDFVAKNATFVSFCRELAMQIASMDPTDVEDLLKQDYIREPDKTVQDLVNEAIQKFGENIRVNRFVRFKLGQD